MFYKLTMLKREVQKHEERTSRRRSRSRHNELEDAYLVSSSQVLSRLFGDIVEPSLRNASFVK